MLFTALGPLLYPMPQDLLYFYHVFAVLINNRMIQYNYLNLSLAEGMQARKQGEGARGSGPSLLDQKSKGAGSLRHHKHDNLAVDSVIFYYRPRDPTMEASLLP